ncbi:hypothetical protein D0863_02149 [Hortaea werneckii]|uniref:Tautomerase/MIF n=1 Tax=Hortaea werneckii TaxID=91943 RepID=A0A3M7EHK9_HORWE|nr:hypothetical protein D0863_02149 [Hortaea werneckii]
MPNINIHTIKGVRSPEELRKLADVVQQCSLDFFKAPPKDRYQVCLCPRLASTLIVFRPRPSPLLPFQYLRAASGHALKLTLCPCSTVQIITQHEPYEIICEDTNLGLKRTDHLVFIQVFQQGRTAEVKQQFYAKLAERLKAECGLEGGDLLVTCIENRKEDWSFGNGEAQFLTGAL